MPAHSKPQQRRNAENDATPQRPAAPSIFSPAPALSSSIYQPAAASTTEAPASEQAAGAAPAGLNFHIGSIAIGPPAGVIQPKLMDGAAWVPGYAPEPAGPTNQTGLPDTLKHNTEQLGGVSLDDVRVHYGSDQPAQIDAAAYTQGSQIHVGPGQEQHLAHEAWHVVQQKQGRVQPTGEIGGQALNNDRGLEQEADQMGAQAATAAPSAAAAPPSQASAAPGVIQGVFNVTRKVFASQEDVEDWQDNIVAKIPKKFRGKISEDELIDHLKGWAAQPGDSVYFKNYDDLVRKAIEEIRRGQAAGLPEVAPQNIRTGAAQRYDSSRLGAAEKVSKLKDLRRIPSLESVLDDDIADFRNTDKMARIKHRENDIEYSIGYGGNLMLGGVPEHTYRELLDLAKTNSGYDDKRLAQTLLRALSGEDQVISALPAGARPYVTKIVGLFQGPEFRRAAMNLPAVMGALNKVISSGGDIFTTLYQDALFVIGEGEASAEGGSMRSQYHRRQVKEDDANFQSTAANEFDNLMTLADANGIDTTDDEAVKTFLRAVTKTGMQGLRQQFRVNGKDLGRSAAPDDVDMADASNDDEAMDED